MGETETKKKSTFWKVVKYILFLGLGVFLTWMAFRGMDWDSFVDGLKSCDYKWIIISMAVGVLGFIFRAMRWQLMLQEMNDKVTLRESYDGVTVGYLTNFILPRAGELARCGVVAKTKKVNFEQALGSVVLERSWDLICLLILVVSILVFKWGEFGSFIGKEMFDPIINSVSGKGIYIAIGIVLFLITLIFATWYYRNKLMNFKFFKKASEILKGLGAGLLSAFRMRRKWLFIIYTILLWGSYWLTSYTTIHAFPAIDNMGAIDALFLMIVGGLGWVVPVQGGIGAYHFIVSLALLKVYAIPQTTGVVFATISHEAQAIIMILCGLISLVSISLWKKKFIHHNKQ